MKPEIPEELLRQAAMWEDLHRWERSQLGKALRGLGLTYGEIRKIIPVPKGTLSNWCNGLRLTEEQIAAIRSRVPSQKGIPRNSQWKRREQIASIQTAARGSARLLASDPVWTAGVALYWAEGSKTDRRLAMSNSDPRLLRTFMRWVTAFVNPNPMYAAALNLHADNDEPAGRRYWADQLGIPIAAFTKTHIKPNGTGHRKNTLPHGVCRVSVRCSTDGWITTMEWIDCLAANQGNNGDC